MDGPAPVLIRVLAAAAACAAAGCAAPATRGAECGSLQHYEVVNHGWHTGLRLPGPDLAAHLPALAQRFAAAEWVEFGWGDAAFYAAPAGTLRLTLAALFLPTTSVLHVAPAPHPPRAQRFRVSSPESDYRSLWRFVAASLDDPAAPAAAGPGREPGAQFFRAARSYHALYTCNSWTADAVAASGVPAPPRRALSARAVVAWLKSAARAANHCTTVEELGPPG